MKVLLAGGIMQKEEHSMLGFVDRLSRALQTEGLDVTTIYGQPPKSTLSPKQRKLSAYLETYVRYPRRVRRQAREVDLVHVSDQGFAHLLKGLSRSVITVHDLMAVRAALGEFDYWQIGSRGRAKQKLVRESLSLAGRAACISTATQNDLKRLVPGLDSAVIDNALYTDFGSYAQSKRQPFFHCLGGNQPYKNRAGIVRIASELLSSDPFLDHRLKVLGREPDQELAAAIEKSPIRDRIDLVIDPDNEAVGRAFGASDGLLFLSHDEGFGLPILEAQSAGCWVVAFDKDPMKSVAGKGALLVHPAGAPAAIAAGYASRSERILHGSENLKRFSAQKMAREYITFYQGAA